jgi:hypothetical protein
MLKPHNSKEGVELANPQLSQSTTEINCVNEVHVKKPG